MAQRFLIGFFFVLIAAAYANILKERDPELWAKFAAFMNITEDPTTTTLNPVCTSHLNTGARRTFVRLFDSTSS